MRKWSVDRVLAASGIPILILFTFVFIFPLYILIKATISNPIETIGLRPTYFIREFTLEAWVRVLSRPDVWPPFSMSLQVATLTAVLALALCVPAAYALIRVPPGIRYGIILALFITRMLPEVAISLPIATILLSLRLDETALGLAMAHLLLVIPIVTFILVGTFDTIPRDLEEAALTDGAGRLQALWHVTIPLALPGIAVAVIFAWLLSWEEFTYALYLMVFNKTLPLQIFQFVDRGEPITATVYAVLVTLPVIVIVYSLQKYLRAGYLAGAVKG